MSDQASARLNLPYLAAGQMQKHVTLNEALTRLDALTQMTAASRTIAHQPDDPEDGALYILPPDAQGSAWEGRPAGTVMRAEHGGWNLVAVPDGLIAAVADSAEVWIRLDGEWRPLGHALGSVQGLTRLGVNTVADAVNPFAARLNKALWAALETSDGGDGDLRLTFNKSEPEAVLSLLFQSGWSGRAELGLIGDDDLRLKVSADGEVWHDAVSIDRASGAVSFSRGAVRAETIRLDADGVYVVPDWGRWIEVEVIGGGGGGASGAVGASGTARLGGGGGGGGGVSRARWPVAALNGELQIIVGAGGEGAAARLSAGAGVSATGGGDSQIVLEDRILLTASGGRPGQGDGTGGSGGDGLARGNGGGAPSLTEPAGTGQSRESPEGPGGGGAGGGLGTGNVARAGGAGGIGAVMAASSAGGQAGAIGAGGWDGWQALLPDLYGAGGGGGGGGASASGTGGKGADAGFYGAGGGGGGAGLTASGAGGDGADGMVRLTVFG